MCFDFAWFFHLLIWLVVVGAGVALLQLLLPRVLGMFGVEGALLMQVIRIIVGAAILIFVIVIAWDLLECLGGTGLGLAPHR